ncbi:lysozyme [Enterobacter mori]|uniref:lysozyme n=1 Tax=Enterobacter mori TaxID=539813 RepID=UPI002015FEF6|nr:lysozyme [Enterobacter mori]
MENTARAMKVSSYGLEFIKREEGLRLNAYQDSANIWTIGYGHTARVLPGDWITLEKAEQLLRDDLVYFESQLIRAIKVPVSQNQFDALASLVFNTGPGSKGKRSGPITLKSGSPSTLLRYLNAGQYQDAAEQFSSWIYAGGQVLKGLVERRAREKALFLR